MSIDAMRVDCQIPSHRCTYFPFPFLTRLFKELRLWANDAFVDQELRIAAFDGEIRVSALVTQSTRSLVSATFSRSKWVCRTCLDSK
jgi:hypothetical protein